MKHIIFKHYYQQTECIIFFIDSSNKENIIKSREELQNVIKMKPLNNVPIIVFCNKQDLDTDSNDSSECFSVDHIIDLIDAKSFILHDSDESSDVSDKKRNSSIVHFLGGSVLTGDGLFELLDWTYNTVTLSNTIKLGYTEPSVEINELALNAMVNSAENRGWPEVDEDVGNWLEREQKQDDETFMEQITSCTFEEDFDHYNLIRLIWICLNRYSGGYSKATDEICKLIERFQKDEYNVTLIYFWSQIVLYALQKIEDQELREKVSRNFVTFIAVNPDLCNSSHLLKTYYSRIYCLKLWRNHMNFLCLILNHYLH